MKHFFKSTLTCALIVLSTAPSYAQNTLTRVSSAGATEYRGPIELKVPFDIPTPGGSGATIVAANVGCVNFTNASSTTAVTVSAQSVVGFSARQIYINGQEISNISIADAGARGAVTVIVPPLATFTSNHDTCTYTAMANNITAQSLGIRFVTSTVYTLVGTGNVLNCSLSGQTYDEYGFNTNYYNYGPPVVGATFARFVVAGCNNGNVN